jgi:putative SOS response-associated peptidase YedK
MKTPLKALLKPDPTEEMCVYLVSSRVNNVKNDDESLIQCSNSNDHSLSLPGSRW